MTFRFEPSSGRASLGPYGEYRSRGAPPGQRNVDRAQSADVVRPRMAPRGGVDSCVCAWDCDPRIGVEKLVFR